MIPLNLVRWQSVVDFVVLTAALYILLRWAQQARALRVALVVLGLHAAALVSRHFDLVLTSWVLDGAAILAIVVLLLVFQAELRRFFMRLDSLLNWRTQAASNLSETYQSIAQAAFRLASGSIGALIVIVRRNAVWELVSGGITLEASVSPEILEAIFQKTSPVHDGAVIARGDRIVRAAAVLPLTERERVPSYYGTRHRAAMGLSERCDALVVVVSEERAEVTLMEGRRITRFDQEPKLAQTLEKLCAEPPADLRSKLRQWLLSNAPRQARRTRPGGGHLEHIVSVHGNHRPHRQRAGPVCERAFGHGHRHAIHRPAGGAGARQRVVDGFRQPDAPGSQLQSARRARRTIEFDRRIR
jgi:diadenylate cyclase